MSVPFNPHPAWKQARCKGCAAGERIVGGIHRITEPLHGIAGCEGILFTEGFTVTDRNCTAPTEAEYIAELEQCLAAREADLQSERARRTAAQDAISGYWTEKVEKLEAQLRIPMGASADTQRLDKVLSLHSPLFVPSAGGWRLIETDCGAMILRGEGKTKRAAIDAAMKDATNA